MLLPTKQKNISWTDHKLCFLAKKCRELKQKRTRNVKKVLYELLPDRSQGSIASVRKQTQLKAIEQALVLQLEQGKSN